MSKILVIRFSALGDVAMIIPVIYSFAAKYREHDIVVLSEKTMKSLFETSPDNVHFIGADIRNTHNGILGLGKLYNELKQEKFDYVADFHSVLRSHYLRLRFNLDGIRTEVIQKGRIEKLNLTRQNNKTLIQLKSSFIRYQEVLNKLGFEFDLNFETILRNSIINLSDILEQFETKNDFKWIGIAPFAKHKGKIYPLELQEKVIEHFANDARIKVFVFGGGKKETEIINGWVKKFPTIISMVGRLNLNQEVAFMSKLDIMYSMDSANMHLASLVGTTVVSLWGATHPYAGFLGWNQELKNVIQIDLACRPCSVYGSKDCYRKDYACLNLIDPQRIIDRIDKLIFENEI
jgi:ADP-heptose:LPS heptosyltransferase